MEIFNSGTPSEPAVKAEESGTFLRVNFKRIFELPKESLIESLEQVKLGYDCPCLKGDKCTALCDDEFMRIRLVTEAHRATTYEFPDNDSQASYAAMIEDLAAMLDNDSETLAALAIHAIRRLNEYERAYRVLKDSE